MKYLVQVQKQTIRKMISMNMKRKFFQHILLFKCRNMLFGFFITLECIHYNVKKKERVYLFGNILLIVCNPYVEH